MVHLELEEGVFAAGPWIDALKGRGGGEAGGATWYYMQRPRYGGPHPIRYSIKLWKDNINIKIKIRVTITTII